MGGKEFQSTPLREGRLQRIERHGDLFDFNPRPFVRGDHYPDVYHVEDVISIHAPS